MPAIGRFLLIYMYDPMIHQMIDSLADSPRLHAAVLSIFSVPNHNVTNNIVTRIAANMKLLSDSIQALTTKILTSGLFAREGFPRN